MTKSTDLNFNKKSILINQAELIKENALTYLDLMNIPYDGNGTISKHLNLNNSKESNKLNKITFLNIDSIEATLKYNNVACLVSCSHKRAGGGWLSGALAQEEAISRVSTWAIQAEQPQFLQWYKESTWLGQNHTLVIDGLFLFNKDFSEITEPHKVTFFGVSAPNRNKLNNDLFWNSVKGKEERINNLVLKLLSAFNELKNRNINTIILCPIGTNIFGWTIEESVSVLLQAVQKTEHNFQFICAVPDNAQFDKISVS